MANPDIQLMGATYQAVSGVTLPTSGGGTATFPFVEGSQNITQNGTVDVTSLAQVIVNVAGGGGGGLTYESGTYMPASDNFHPTISFANTHSTRPFCAMIVDTGGESSIASTDSILDVFIANWYDFIGDAIYTSTTYLYGRFQFHYKTSSGSSASGGNITDLNGSNSAYMSYSLTSECFKPYSNSSSRYFRAGRTYKWVAVWAPTT